jgi:hypothetical protein
MSDTIEDQIARDMQRKIAEDVTKAAYRVLNLMPQEHYFSLLLQATTSMVQMSAELVDGETEGRQPRAASHYLVALMAVHAHLARRCIKYDELMAMAQRDMEKLGVRFDT